MIRPRPILFHPSPEANRNNDYLINSNLDLNVRRTNKTPLIYNQKRQRDAVDRKKKIVANSKPLKELRVEFSRLDKKRNDVLRTSRSFNIPQRPRTFKYCRFQPIPLISRSSRLITLSSLNKNDDVSKSATTPTSISQDDNDINKTDDSMVIDYNNIALDPIDLYPRLTEDQEASVEKLLKSNTRTSHDGIIDKFNLTVTYHDIYTLKPGTWINDQVINFYGKLIVERSTNNNRLPSVFVFSTQFMTKYLNSGYQGVSKWTKKVDIFSKDLLFIPIHSGVHWSLCLVDFQTFRIDYIDSMYSGTIKGNSVINDVKEYLVKECGNKKGENANLDFKDWSANPKLKAYIIFIQIPQQKNSYDCGVFTLAFIEHISRQAPLSFDQTFLPYFRKKIIYEIAFGELLT